MKKFSIMLAVIALSACASSDYQQQEAAAPAQDKSFVPRVIQFHAGERAPSSADCDDTASWQPSPVPPITVAASGGTLTQNVTIKQVQNCRQQVLVDSTCYEDVPSPDGATQSVTYTSYAGCGQISGGNGKSPLWNAYYSASADQKAMALAKAIKGVGPKSADALVQAHSFDRKPRSWDQFSQIINDAANQSPPIISRSVRTQVLGTYAADNMQALGYDDTSSCTGTQVTEQVPVLISQGYTCQQPQTQTYQNVLSAVSQSVTMNISPTVLQPSERDQFSATLAYDGRNISVSDTDGGPYNSYTANVVQPDPSKTVINFKWQVRNHVSLPGDILVNTPVLQAVVGGTANLTLQINLNKYPQSNPNDQVMVDYSISSCAVGGFGVCSNAWGTSRVLSRPLINGSNTISFTAPHDHKFKITYSIYRRNSLYYDSQPLGQQTTNAVRGSL